MENMKNLLKSLVFGLVLMLVLAACGNGGEEEEANSEDTSGDAEASTEEKTEITFWHAMSGDNGAAIEDVVDQFNAQSDTVSVEAIFQGSYEDLLTKLRAVGGSEEAPAIVQVFEGGTKYMSESGFITPMQEFIDADDFDVSILEPNILAYYELDGQLYSMPFNTSNAIMYYNKDMFQEAGLDPENPPRSFSEMKEAAETLTTDNTQGFSFATISWFFEELMANNGGLIINNDNGRSGDATEATVNSEVGVEIVSWVKEMNDAGTFRNYGSSWDDPRGPFFAGELGMYFDSTANLAQVIDNSPHEVGTAPIPHADDIEPQGAVVGGASVWITNQVSEEEQQAAWEFVKFTTEPAVQAEWAAATGYFPITPAAYEEDVLTEVYDANPQYLTAVEQLENTIQSPATAGALFSIMPEARVIIETALGEVYEGRDVEEALDDAAANITDALE
jgi:sn-glycerol 3-phosphate transport system substrate-binding protein